MKKFQQGLKEKAHLSKIRQAKPTIATSIKSQTKMGTSKIADQAQLLLDLFEKKNYNLIPAYKLLRTAGLQQYTRGFIQRGYGINLGKLALIDGDDKKKLYEELKILPGHTVKLDKIIDTLAKSSYSSCNIHGLEVDDAESQPPSCQPAQKSKLKVLTKKDADYQKQLERVLNEYTPQSEAKKKFFNIKSSEKKSITPIIPNNHTNYAKTKYSATNKEKSLDFKKKAAETSTKPTIKKGGISNIAQPEHSKRQALTRILKNIQHRPSMSTKEIMEINLQLEKVKALNRSFDGALMTSTIANIDVQELVYAFSGLVSSKVTAVLEPKTHYQSSEQQIKESFDNTDDIEDQVGEILKESYLHPLYKEEVQQDLVCDEDAYSEGEYEQQQIKDSLLANQFVEEAKLMQSSFLGGAESVDFGNTQPLKIFDEPEPTAIDYFKPTIDSVSNFIKNIVLTAKMEREIPIMAAAYLENFMDKTHIQVTSLNYKRYI